MEIIEKRIQIDENRVLIYRIMEGFVKPTYSIMEGFIKDGDVQKTYILSQWDDYGLNGWTKDEESNELLFEFDMNHPLFLPLLHLLNYDDELIIEDDDTREYNKKYLSIHRNGKTMVMNFVDKLSYESYMNYSERFHVFVKNIMHDGRSKIDQSYKDTKKRLIDFFNEINKIIMSDTYQISMEEYILNNFPEEESSELVRAFKRKH